MPSTSADIPLCPRCGYHCDGVLLGAEGFSTCPECGRFGPLELVSADMLATPSTWQLIRRMCGPVLGGCFACLLLLFLSKKAGLNQSASGLGTAATMLLALLGPITAGAALFLPVFEGFRQLLRIRRYHLPVRRTLLLAMIALILNGTMVFLVGHFVIDAMMH